MLLPLTMAAANALLDALGIPWQVIVHHEGAELEIDALCPGLRGDHDVTAALPGTLTRIFALIAKMKLSAGYTDAIGTDLGIVGSAETEKALPKFSADLLQGGACQCVKLTFYKYNHMGVYIES